MDEYVAISRLQEHFRIHDDGRPTPLLNEACAATYQALGNQKWLRERLIEIEKNPTATGYEGFFNDLYKVYVFGWKDGQNEICTMKPDRLTLTDDEIYERFDSSKWCK